MPSTETRRRFWRIAWLAGLGLVCLLRFPGNFTLHPPFLMDLEVYRAVALRVVHGQAAALYEPTTSAVMLFKYAPCWAILWAPLAWCSPHAAAVLWSIGTVGWLVFVCWGSAQLCRQAGVEAPPWLSTLAVIVLVRSVTAEFLNGQTDILWGALVVAFLLAHHRGRPWLAAGLLAMAVALKLPAALVVAYLALTRHRAVAARALAWLLGVNLAASLLLRPTAPLALFADWMRVLSSSGASRAFEIGNQSLLALLGRFLTAGPYGLHVADLPVGAVTALAALLGLLLFAAVALPRPAPAEAPARLTFDTALLMILMVLCSPTVWVATYSALLFPVTLGVGSVLTAWRRRRWRAWSIGAVAVIGLLGLMTNSSFWRAIGVRSIRGETYVFLVLMVLPWFGLALFAALRAYRRALASLPVSS